MKIVVLGAGIMGLASAFDLLEEGHDVTLLESAPRPGGLAGSFDFGEVRAEKFYHFICGADRHYFRWLSRLGLSRRLRWRRTRMALYHDGELHPFGDPIALLRFAPLAMGARLRYGLHILQARARKDWRALEEVPARDWLVSAEGEEAYRIIWEPLLREKFREETENLSAAWIWSRIHRLGSSRRGLFQEWLGYVEGGGSRVILEALVRGVEAKGGQLRCDTPVEEILLDEGRAAGVRSGSEEFPAEAILSTIPLPILVEVGWNLPEAYRRAALDLGNIGVRCVVLKTRQPLSPYFWINVNEKSIPIVGLIEYTNLCPAETFGGHHLVYSPHYVAATDPEYRRPAEEVLEETLAAIESVVPRFDRGQVVDYRVFRAPYAQPICPVGFSRRLAPIRTPVANLVAADTSHLLPHDRSISDSLALAERLTGELRGAMAEGLSYHGP